MRVRGSSGTRRLRSFALGGAVALAAGVGSAQAQSASPRSVTAPAFTVNARVALYAYTSLSDAHLARMADVLTLLAATDAARSARWERIRAPLAEASRMNVPAALWFARPSGAYWTVERGRSTATLADRPYFPRVLAGHTVIGELVVSRSTSRNSAIVAVPVRGHDRAVVGVLGASVRLDSLGALVRREMGGLDDGLLFFAIDSQPIGALNSDPTLIFTEPMKLGDEGMRRAFREMLAGSEGVVTYSFRGSRRTVLYRKSAVTGWWHGFGTLHP